MLNFLRCSNNDNICISKMKLRADFCLMSMLLNVSTNIFWILPWLDVSGSLLLRQTYFLFESIEKPRFYAVLQRTWAYKPATAEKEIRFKYARLVTWDRNGGVVILSVDVHV